MSPMPKRSRKLPTDPDRLATTSKDAPSEGGLPGSVTAEGKDPAAVALGRRGGLKGGKRRLVTMTAAQRTESARKAARARWHEKKPSK